MKNVFGWIFIAVIVWILCAINNKRYTPEERQRKIDYEAEKFLRNYGPISPMYICPIAKRKATFAPYQ